MQPKGWTWVSGHPVWHSSFFYSFLHAGVLCMLVWVQLLLLGKGIYYQQEKITCNFHVDFHIIQISFYSLLFIHKVIHILQMDNTIWPTQFVSCLLSFMSQPLTMPSPFPNLLYNTHPQYWTLFSNHIYACVFQIVFFTWVWYFKSQEGFSWYYNTAWFDMLYFLYKSRWMCKYFAQIKKQYFILSF